MKREGYFIVSVFCLLLILQVPVYAASVDGFIGVPWGASKDKVIKAMQDKGFKVSPPFDTHFWGEFGGYSSANLEFFLERNSFYWGSASVCHTGENSGYNQVHACGQNMENMLRNKYGTQTERRNTHSNAYKITWKGIKNSTGSDDITVSLWVSYPDELNGGVVRVEYKNESLLKRIKEAGESDI